LPAPPTASFTYYPPQPFENETVTFDASSSTPNGGTIVSYEWNFGDGNITTMSEPIIVHTYSNAGTYNVILNVTDSEGAWNTTSKTIAVYKSGDIAVTDVKLAKTVVGQGFTCKINATVQNQGDYEETFNVTLYANTTAITTQTLTLTSGSSTTITFTWNTTGFAKGNYTITAYAWPVPGETDTDDNRFTDGVVTVTIAGDLDGNLAVQLVDLVILAKAYGSKPSEPPWNPNADLDDNGVVGLTDLVTLAKNYGKTDP
jgi:PKD repeat protein